MVTAMTRTLTIVRDGRGIAQALRTPVCLFRVVRGPDKGQQRRLSAERMVIGTGQTADVRLTDETVSALHVEIFLEADGVRVRDLGSKNGVFLAGHRVSDAWLGDDDELQVGGTVLRFKILDEDQEHALSERVSLGRLRGSSIRMRQLYEQLLKTAKTDAAVLLRGDTGTGKELAAEAIALESRRQGAPFEVVDCPALASGLAESELFGHEQGAFSGAVKAHAGAFERAHKGTVFLDEVGELTPELQVKLLGVLERHSVQRVGGLKPLALDVRVIASTRRDLERDVNSGQFRADLFFRLAVLSIRLPPLSERREDIPELIGHFLSELPSRPRLLPGQIKQLCERDYPGNVRELKGAVERMAIGLDLPAEEPTSAGPLVDLKQPFQTQKEQLVARFEARYILALLEECGGSVSEVARRSGLNRTHLYRVISRLNPDK
jgi:DNA-binding NtrC family response regulator